MKIAITTAAGRVGSKVVRQLISQDAELILLARDDGKVREFAERATIRTGSQDDQTYFTEATRGADVLFWVTPPDLKSRDLRKFQKACGLVVARAIEKNHIGRVVNLSSVGAQVGDGCGPVTGLHEVELLLESAAENLIHLRPGWFFENLFYHVEPLKQQSALFFPIDGNRRLPMIATADIATAAARLLTDQSWTGHGIRGLHGPADLSMTEVADQLSRGLDHSIRYVRVGEVETQKNLLAAGCSENVAASLVEMYRAIDQGLMKSSEPRTRETTTPTTLRDFARYVLRPLVGEPATMSHR